MSHAATPSLNLLSPRQHCAARTSAFLCAGVLASAKRQSSREERRLPSLNCAAARLVSSCVSSSRSPHLCLSPSV